MKTEKQTNSRGEHLGVDFGTYHHSTPEESNVLRNRVEVVFSKLLKDLYPPKTPLQIMDAGCGLGFLMYVAASCFPKAHITGVDLFRHNSMSEMSVEKAIDNMRSLDLESRTSFLKHDLLKPLETEAQYDLAISNLVFHNMGKKRFKAYETVFNVLKPGGFFIIGDLFPHDNADMDYFHKRSTLLNELDEGSSGPWAYRIKLLHVNQSSSLQTWNSS
ncbi:MAG: class I SAM-dependent methyltransferase [Acidobacterium ailaaui]|nr:class I SAM-dependent methyltransferase [Pseudacidobacterium ailaaui]